MMVTNGILRWVGWGEFLACATGGHFGTSVCRTKTRPCFRSDAGGSRLVLSGPQARYAGGPASLYYRAVTEPHLAAFDKNIARCRHHLNLVGIGRVVLCLRLCLRKAHNETNGTSFLSKQERQRFAANPCVPNVQGNVLRHRAIFVFAELER